MSRTQNRGTRGERDVRRGGRSYDKSRDLEARGENPSAHSVVEDPEGPVVDQIGAARNFLDSNCDVSAGGEGTRFKRNFAVAGDEGRVSPIGFAVVLVVCAVVFVIVATVLAGLGHAGLAAALIGICGMSVVVASGIVVREQNRQADRRQVPAPLAADVVTLATSGEVSVPSGDGTLETLELRPGGSGLSARSAAMDA